MKKVDQAVMKDVIDSILSGDRERQRASDLYKELKALMDSDGLDVALECLGTKQYELASVMLTVLKDSGITPTDKTFNAVLGVYSSQALARSVYEKNGVRVDVRFKARDAMTKNVTDTFA